MESQLAKIHKEVELVQFRKKTIPFVNPRLTDAYFMRKQLCAYLDNLRGKDTTMIAFQSASAAIDVCRKKGIRIICRLSNHPSAVKYEHSMVRKLSEWLRPHTYRKADVVIANSKKLAADFEQRIGKNVHVIYNPIDINQIHKLAEEEIETELKEEALRFQGRLFVSVGRLTVQKDYETMIKGFALCKYRDTKLWILGEGSEREKLLAFIDELQLSDRIRLIGYRNNVYKYLKYATIYLLSSRYEGCPNSLIEAAAMGIPCIAADCLTGPDEVLLSGEGGLLFPVGEADKLAACMDLYLEDMPIAKEKSKKAIEQINRFSIQNTIDGYSHIL
jgi:glycosyltransferase involved in cell wall biosynthesis